MAMSPGWSEPRLPLTMLAAVTRHPTPALGGTSLTCTGSSRKPRVV